MRSWFLTFLVYSARSLRALCVLKLLPPRALRKAAAMGKHQESASNNPKLRAHTLIPPEGVYNPLAIFAAVENRACPSPR